MKVFYYYYYLFYTRVLPDSEPHATVVFTLSLSESLLVNFFLQFILAVFFCFKLKSWLMISVFVLILVINYKIYWKRKDTIVEDRPNFLSSHRLTIAIVILWFLITTSFLFLGPFYTKNVLDRCY